MFVKINGILYHPSDGPIHIYLEDKDLVSISERPENTRVYSLYPDDSELDAEVQEEARQFRLEIDSLLFDNDLKEETSGEP